MAKTLFRVTGLLLALWCAAFSCQAQYLTGGDPSAPALKGCLILNALPRLNNGAPGSCSDSGGSPAQLAGSLWVSTISGDGTFSGTDWILSALPNPPLFVGITNVPVYFKVPFVKQPVCVAAAYEQPDYPGNIRPVDAVLATTTTSTVITFESRGVDYPLGPLFTLMCTIGQ